jgi:hypothetical protein
VKTKKKSPDRNREISGKKGTKEEELKQREEERDLNVMQGEKRSSTHWENRLRSRRKREMGKKFDSKLGGRNNLGHSEKARILPGQCNLWIELLSLKFIKIFPVNSVLR